MKPVERLPDFVADYEIRFAWYLHEADEEIASKFETAAGRSSVKNKL